MKIERIRRNEAAIVIQRNCSTKYRNVLSLARITMVSLRHFNLMVGEVAQRITDLIVDEHINSAVEKWGLNWDRIALPALSAVSEQTIDHVLMETAERAGIMWLEEQYRAILEENQRLTEERVQLEENVDKLVKGADTSNGGESVKTKSALFEVDLDTFFGDDNDNDENDDDGHTSPGFNFTSSVTSFVGKITAKAITRASMSMSTEELAAVLSTAAAGKEQISRRDSVSEFVSKVANKAVHRASLLITANEPQDNVAAPTFENNALHNHFGDSVSDFVTGITRRSVLQLSGELPPSEQRLTKGVEDEETTATKHRLQEIAVGLADSSISAALSSVAELQSTLVDNRLVQAPPTEHNVAGNDTSGGPLSFVPLHRNIVAGLTDIGLTDQQKEQVQGLVQTAFSSTYLGNFLTSLQQLSELLALIHHSDWIPANHRVHSQYLGLNYDIQLLQAINLYSLADFVEAKRLFDAVHKHRAESAEAEVGLVVEIQLHLAEWHRSQAEYNESDLYFTQAIANAEKGLLALEEQQHLGNLGAKLVPERTAFLLNLHARLLVCYTELLKNRGQYYKANAHIAMAQDAVRSNKSKGANEFETQVELIVCLISLFVIKGKYGNAVSLHQELLDKRRMHYGLRHPKVATSMNALGALMLLKCEFEEARRLIDEGLAMRLEYFGDSDHPAIAASLHTRAQCFIALGEYQKAFADSASSLEMRVRLFGATHPSVAQSLTSVAHIQTLMGLPVEALVNYSNGLSIRKERFGTDLHRDVAESVFLMAINAQMRGCYAEAMSYFEQCVELRQELLPLLGPDVKSHLDLEVAKVHLGLAYMGAFRVDEAKEIMKQSVKSVCAILGNSHMVVSRCMTSLGELCKVRSNCADAKNLFAAAFNIVNNLFGDAHPEIVRIMLQSADNFRIPGYYSEAAELSLSAYHLCIDTFGDGSLFVAQAQCVHARILRDSGRLREAESVYLHALNTLLSRVGEHSGLYGEALAELAECHRMQDKGEVAERAFLQALTILKNVSGEHSSLLETDTLCNYAVWLLDQGNAESAVVILADSVFPLYEQRLGSKHVKAAYAKANLGLCAQENSSAFTAEQQHSDILAFLQLCEESGYSPAHPWVLRFSVPASNKSPAASQSVDRDYTANSGNSVNSPSVTENHSESHYSESRQSESVSRALSYAPDSSLLEGGRSGVTGVTGDVSLEEGSYFAQQQQSSLENSLVDVSRADSAYEEEYEADLFSNSLVSHPTLESRTVDTGSRTRRYESSSREGDGETYSSSGNRSRSRSPSTLQSVSVSRGRRFTNASLSTAASRLRNLDAASTIDDSWEQGLGEDGAPFSASLDIFSTAESVESSVVDEEQSQHSADFNQ